MSSQIKYLKYSYEKLENLYNRMKRDHEGRNIQLHYVIDEWGKTDQEKEKIQKQLEEKKQENKFLYTQLQLYRILSHFQNKP